MKSFFEKNLGLKAISLLLAYLAWTSAVGRPPRIDTEEIPVRLAHPNESLMIVEQSPRKIEIQIEGDDALWDESKIKQMYIEPLILHLPPGRHQIRLSESELRNAPNELEIDLAESIIDFTIEERLTRSALVVPKISGEPREGFSRGAILVDPPTVTISGPKSRIESIDEIATEPLDLADAQRTIRRELRLLATTYVELDPQSVRATVTVYDESVQHVAEIDVESPENRGRVSPGKVEVTISAPKSRWEEILGAALVTIDDAVIDENATRAPVVVTFPGLSEELLAHVTIISVVPPDVSVEARPRPR